MENTFNIAPDLAQAVEVLTATPKGGIANVEGYVQDGRTMLSPRVTDRRIITRFSVTKLYERRIKALSALKPEEGDDTELFHKAKTELIASNQKTLDGIRDDAHRKGHDRCYVNFDNGVVGHYETEKIGGKMQPVLRNGKPTVESIMLNVLELSTTVKVEGEYKPVKSRPLTIMKRKLEGRLPKTYNMKRLSLKTGKFDLLKMGGVAMDTDLDEVIV